jgi:hypothetical protein
MLAAVRGEDMSSITSIDIVAPLAVERTWLEIVTASIIPDGMEICTRHPLMALTPGYDTTPTRTTRQLDTPAP